MQTHWDDNNGQWHNSFPYVILNILIVMNTTKDLQRMEGLRINRLIGRWQLDFKREVSLPGRQKGKGSAGKGRWWQRQGKMVDMKLLGNCGSWLELIMAEVDSVKRGKVGIETVVLALQNGRLQCHMVANKIKIKILFLHYTSHISNARQQCLASG